MTYTRGPWTIEKCADYCGNPNCNKHWLSNGSFYQGSGFDLADATLIAAAPDILEALEKIAAEKQTPGPGRAFTIKSRIQCGEIASAAIKAATKEPSG